MQLDIKKIKADKQEYIPEIGQLYVNISQVTGAVHLHVRTSETEGFCFATKNVFYYDNKKKQTRDINYPITKLSVEYAE